MKRWATHPFELAAHQQYPSPDSPLGALLSWDAVKVPLAVAQEHLSQTAEAAMLFFINLYTAEWVDTKNPSDRAHLPCKAGTIANLPS